MRPINGSVTVAAENAWQAAEGAYAMTSESVRDRAVRVRFREDTGHFAVSLQANGGAHSGDEHPEGRLSASELGLVFRPSGSKSYREGKWNEVVLCIQGGRVAALVNGRLADERRDLDLPEELFYALLLPWQGGEMGRYFVSDVEILVER